MAAQRRADVVYVFHLDREKEAPAIARSADRQRRHQLRSPLGLQEIDDDAPKSEGG